MAEPTTPQLIRLTKFFKDHATLPQPEFLEKFPGAFVLARCSTAPPEVIFLPREEGLKVTVGSDEDVTMPFEMDPTIDPKHATLAYHPGFKGWTIEDHKTSFGSTINGERLTADRPLLLQDRQVVRVGGQTELQFYLAETLWTRMSKAGITKGMKRPKKPDA